MFTSPSPELPEGTKVIFGDRSNEYGVWYTRDIEYARPQPNGTPLYIQLLHPTPNASRMPFPLLIYIQGSAYFEQNCYCSLPLLTDIARAGYVIASVKHRSSDVAKSPAFLVDVKTAIRFLRKNAAEYNIDPNRFAIMGESSGGHISSMVGVSEDVADFETEEYGEYSSGVQAVVDIFGPSDITKFFDTIPRKEPFEDHPTARLIGGLPEDYPERAQQINPMKYLDENKTIPPFLILHGDSDGSVPFNQSVLLYEALRKHKKQVTFYKVLGAEHGRFLRSKTLMDIVIAFLGAYV